MSIEFKKKKLKVQRLEVLEVELNQVKSSNASSRKLVGLFGRQGNEGKS